MLVRIYNRLASLTLGLWLTGGVLLLLAIGSFAGGGEGNSDINNMPLFAWLRETPLPLSWWLWGTLGLLALLAMNTVLCSVESLRTKAGSSRFIAVIAPQVMHAGFLLIVLAHLFSARGGFKQVMPVMENGVIGFPDGTALRVTNLGAAMDPRGFPLDFSADIRYPDGGREGVRTIRPNEPFFYEGAGVYLKEVALYPYRAALIEVHREPGAGCALAGALVFTAGNVMLLAVRRGRRE